MNQFRYCFVYRESPAYCDSITVPLILNRERQRESDPHLAEQKLKFKANDAQFKDTNYLLESNLEITEWHRNVVYSQTVWKDKILSSLNLEYHMALCQLRRQSCFQHQRSKNCWTYLKLNYSIWFRWCVWDLSLLPLRGNEFMSIPFIFNLCKECLITFKLSFYFNWNVDKYIDHNLRL